MNILTAMTEKTMERHEKYNKVFYVDSVQPLTSLIKEYTFLGNYSHTKKTSNERIISNESKIILENDLGETPPFVARTYLEIKYKRGPRVTSEQYKVLKDGLRPVPSYAIPTTFEYGYYIDIKSAWWDIQKIVGWDVDYYPGKWLADGTHPDDFPFPENKLARSCLVSAGSMTGVPYINPSIDYRVRILATGNSIANASIRRVINDVLNSIATQAVKAGAVYVNNDGFIAPDENSAGAIIQIIKNWGLEARIKGKGAGGVKGGGSYKTGTYYSKPWMDRDVASESVKNVWKPPYISWLENRFSFWASKKKS